MHNKSRKYTNNVTFLLRSISVLNFSGFSLFLTDKIPWIFQDFSSFFFHYFKVTSNFFWIKICNLKEPHLNKSWSFLQHNSVFLPFWPILSIWRVLHSSNPKTRSKISEPCPFFQILYNFSRIIIKSHKIRWFFHGYCDFIFPGLVGTLNVWRRT